MFLKEENMKSKFLLFFGIILLIVGIVVKKASTYESVGLALIILGVICKSIYIVSKARSGEYKPGKELLFLTLGLMLFLSGLYLRSIEQEIINATYLVVAGIGLKIVFIIGFIQNVRAVQEKQQNLV